MTVCKKRMMINKIKNVPNQKTVDLAYLKSSELPLFLYGTGSYATDVKQFLDKHAIYLDGVVLDETYYKDDLFFEDYKVQLLHNVLSNYATVNIIIAFSEYRDRIAALTSHPQVARCMFIDAPNLEDHFFDYEYIKKDYSIWAELYEKLEDDHSRQVLVAFINAKISGFPGDLYDLNVKGEKQYFPSFLRLSDSEVFVDCGAFDGDTILEFDKQTAGKYNQIYAFECDPVNIGKLKNNVGKLNNVEIIQKGCFSRKGILSFSNRGSGISKIEENGNFQIEIDAIDNMISNKEVSFIKMDIEGAELEALKGAKSVITKKCPQLAISVYHKPEDLITIPQYILLLNKNYKIYLRHYGYNSWETILYAINTKL